MQTLDISQVDVVNACAWEAAISNVSIMSGHPEHRGGHPKDQFDLLGMGTPLAQFIVRFAVEAQIKIREGKVFADFADKLVEEVMQVVGRVTRSGVKWMIELLRKHWKHSKEIGTWTY